MRRRPCVHVVLIGFDLTLWCRVATLPLSADSQDG